MNEIKKDKMTALN